MTEAAAILCLSETFGLSERRMTLFAGYVAILLKGNESQNLIAKSTEAAIWSRHILDSVQLLPMVKGRTADVGSGAGLPGVVLLAMGAQIELIEPRRRRIEFLRNVIRSLGLDGVVHPFHVERVNGAAFDTITARAYARLDEVFSSTLHLSRPGTRWVLPKGRNGISELELARRTWHGRFITIPSITDPDAVIIVAEDVRPKV